MRVPGPYERHVKRPLDFVIAILAILVASPLLVLIASLVFVVMGRPILFRQSRVGLNNRIFTILKFRTMVGDGAALPDSDAVRLTKLGRWRRRTSLDELPELLNVVRGEMSMVGPRPLLVQYLPRYSARQARRHEVRPGLTGWAQMNGRNAIGWEKKFEHDVFYVDHLSAWLDVRIFFSTIGQVISGRGISEAGHASAREFKG